MSRDCHGKVRDCWSKPHVVVVEGVPQRQFVLGYPAWGSRCPLSLAFGGSRTRLLCHPYFLCTSDAFLRVMFVKALKVNSTLCTFAAEHSRPSSEFWPGCNAGTKAYRFLCRATRVPCTVHQTFGAPSFPWSQRPSHTPVRVYDSVSCFMFSTLRLLVRSSC